MAALPSLATPTAAETAPTTAPPAAKGARAFASAMADASSPVAAKPARSGAAKATATVHDPIPIDPVIPAVLVPLAVASAPATPARATERPAGTQTAAIRDRGTDAAPVIAAPDVLSVGEALDAALAAPVMAALHEAKGHADQAVVAATPTPLPQAEAAAPTPAAPTPAAPDAPTASLMVARAALPAAPAETRTSSPRKARDTAERVATADPIPADAASTATAPVADPAKPATLATAPDTQPRLVDDGAGRHLDLARQTAWLDGLSRDIASIGAPSGTLRFAVAPQHLGAVQVELARGSDGAAAVTLTASSEQSRAALADARPQLITEARAQGLHIASAQVDVSTDPRSSGGHAQPHAYGGSAAQAGGGHGERRDAQTRSQPIAANPTDERRPDTGTDEPEARPASRADDGLYA